MISGNSNGVTVRKAQLPDLDSVKALADAHKSELGFIVRAALEKSITTSELLVAVDAQENLLGFVHYRHRKDGQTTLYNIVVTSSHQGQGIGRRLLDTLVHEARDNTQKFILLKCPSDLPANEFYRSYGFALATTEQGKHRPLNIWVVDLATDSFVKGLA